MTMRPQHIAAWVLVILACVSLVFLVRTSDNASQAQLVNVASNADWSSKQDVDNKDNEKHAAKDADQPQPVKRMCKDVLRMGKFLTASDRQRFSERTGRALDEPPPLIWSIPGSGNTMVRALIDTATGFYTGSIYNDHSLIDILRGESHCDQQVIAIKLHPYIPQRISYEDTFLQPFGKVWPRCQGFTKPFSSAVIIVRHPIDAIWADYQRFITKGDHTALLTSDVFDADDFERRARHTANKWNKSARDHLRFIREHDQDRSLLVKFEDLIDTNLHVSELTRIVKFLGADQFEEQIRCSFRAAERPEIHRPKPQGAEAAKVVTKSQAYGQIHGGLCSVWAMVRQAAQELGYSLEECEQQ